VYGICSWKLVFLVGFTRSQAVERLDGVGDKAPYASACFDFDFVIGCHRLASVCLQHSPEITLLVQQSIGIGPLVIFDDVRFAHSFCARIWAKLTLLWRW
jgi:hypothetical protein